MPATWHHTSSDGETDSFILSLPLKAGKKLNMAVAYAPGNGEASKVYWDGNYEYCSQVSTGKVNHA
jgi:hypothetical protein